VRCLGFWCAAGSALASTGAATLLQLAAAWAAARLDTQLCMHAAGLGFLTLPSCRGLGDTKTPFVGTLLANALNILLEYLLLFVLGWGVGGAALAVGLSQVRKRRSEERRVGKEVRAGWLRS